VKGQSLKREKIILTQTDVEPSASTVVGEAGLELVKFALDRSRGNGSRPQNGEDSNERSKLGESEHVVRVVWR
jgi:hypothetical protein